MPLFLNKDFKFDAAHSLVNYHGKCENLHGHTYKLRVTVKATMLPENGMILDFVEMSRIVKENVIDKLDHSFINDTVPQSTAENIVMWIHGRLAGSLKTEIYELYEITLWETETSSATWRKDEAQGCASAAGVMDDREAAEAHGPVNLLPKVEDKCASAAGVMDGMEATDAHRQDGTEATD